MPPKKDLLERGTVMVSKLWMIHHHPKHDRRRHRPRCPLGFYELDSVERREGLLTSGSVKIDSNWVFSGAARYDIAHNNLSQTSAGLGYIDDCFLIGLNYITDYTYSTSIPKSNHTVMLQLGLRTIGSTSSSGLSGSSQPMATNQ